MTLVIFYIIILIFSVILHELSHGFVALRLGDQTAKQAGRLTLNPLKHLDIFGSLIVPLALALMNAPVFGWAKPVPYDPRNLKNPKRDSGLIAIAGPLTNFSIAVVIAIVTRVLVSTSVINAASALYLLLNLIIQTNLVLAFFNLIPIPPLDGSGLLFSILPYQAEPFMRFLYRYGIYILLAIIFLGVDFLSPLIVHTHEFLIGQPFY